jgi:hypothetical protein
MAVLVWAVDSFGEVKPDTLPEAQLHLMELTVCRGEYESRQIALRAESKKVSIHAEAGNFSRLIGRGSIEACNLSLRKAESPTDLLIPLPESFELEPNCTQSIWLTVYVPEEAVPGAYQSIITIRAGETDIPVILHMKVMDIIMPPVDRQEDTILRVTRREGIEVLHLLRLLEQEQLKAAKLQKLDLNNFDPGACGRKIYQGLSGFPAEGKINTDADIDISALQKVKSDVISAILDTRIPFVDAGDTILVKAAAAPTTPADYAYGTAGRFSFLFRIEWSPSDTVHAGDSLRFTFRDLFSGRTTSCLHPINEPSSGNAEVTLTPEAISLKPSSYHVRIDIMRGTRSLSPIAPGACHIYLTGEEESPKHMLASYMVSRLAYMWDEKRKLHYHMLPSMLPHSGDPFNPDGRPLYERELRLEIARMKYNDWTGCHPMENAVPEAHYDGGSGILQAALGFRRIGETERALFCERALSRIVELALVEMTETDRNGNLQAVSWGPLQQDCIILKLLCEAYLHYRDVAGDTAYADSLLEKIRLIGEYQLSQPIRLGCSESKVYDGRILVGFASFSLFENAAKGKFTEAHVKTVMDFAAQVAEQTAGNNGWHDFGGPEGHDGYGSMNAIWGLLAARRIALSTGQEVIEAKLKRGILSAFDFLARTNSSLTGYTQWIPSRHGYWCAGDTYLMLNEIGRQCGENKLLEWYKLHLHDRDMDRFAKLTTRHGETTSLGSRNALTLLIRECDEYKER